MIIKLLGLGLRLVGKLGFLSILKTLRYLGGKLNWGFNEFISLSIKFSISSYTLRFDKRKSDEE